MDRTLLVALVVYTLSCTTSRAAEDDQEQALANAVSLYASFDEKVRADYGGGDLTLHTRFDHPTEKGRKVYQRGYPVNAFRIAAGKGVAGGALEGVDVLPRRGRIYFPAKGNIAYRAGGWGGAVSMWLNTDPNTLLKTRFCDPVQITQKRAHDGAIWVDFPDVKPRDFRMGVFPALAEGQQPVKESDPAAPLVRLKKVGFQVGNWHHVLITWNNFDTGKPNAQVELYVDGRKIGGLTDRQLAMGWEIDKTGIYVAVSYIGLFDEFAVFKRSLTSDEIALLYRQPDLLNRRLAAGRAKQDKRGGSDLKQWSQRVANLKQAGVAAGDARLEELRTELLTALRAELLTALAASPTQSGENLLTLLLALPPRSTSQPKRPSFPFNTKEAGEYQRAYASWSGLPPRFTNRLGMSFRLIPPGEFQMGSPSDEPGRGTGGRDETQHHVGLTQPFYLAEHEVTVGQFQAFVDATGYVTDGERNGGGHAHDDKAVWKHRPGTQWRKPGYAGPFVLLDSMPAVHVSHHDTGQFCRWLDESAQHHRDSKLQYGLPTEAQWEWACRAGSGTRYWWGEELDDTGRRINVGDQAIKATHPEWPRQTMPMNDGHAFAAPVGGYAANAFGIYDMLGNVWEFCSTRYGPYPRGLSLDPGDLDPKRGFAVRGGGWSNEPGDARCATRNADPPHFCHSNLGFRVALPLPAR